MYIYKKILVYTRTMFITNIIEFENIFFLGIMLISNNFEEHKKVLLKKHLSTIFPLPKHGTVVTVRHTSIKFKT